MMEVMITVGMVGAMFYVLAAFAQEIYDAIAERTRDRKDRHLLPFEMRTMTADQLAAVYTEAQLYSVYKEYYGDYGLTRRGPRVLEDAILLKRACDALEKKEETK